ncbi:MAG TPA: hypothetical protein VGM05_10870 [Planctomycetaceae bacterium]|jgi:hypothetical protein
MDESLIADRVLAESAAAGRECGECAACCTVLAVHELQKPARWACDHVGCHGCGVYETRPESCREFNCLWLRGALNPDPALRPDKLGVMFDRFYSLAVDRDRCVAFELWNGACDNPRAADLLRRIATEREVDVSYRDGTWRTIGTAAISPQDVPGGDSRETRGNCTTGGGRTENDRI